MGSFGLVEWILIILVLLLFFGAKRIPDMARGLAQGYKEFRKARLGEPEEGGTGSGEGVRGGAGDDRRETTGEEEPAARGGSTGSGPENR